MALIFGRTSFCGLGARGQAGLEATLGYASRNDATWYQ